MTESQETIPGKKLKVFIVEEDKDLRGPLYQTICRMLDDAGIAGATVFRGVEGFGERRVVHTAKQEISSLNLPVTIEATDTPEKIDAVAYRIAELLSSGLVEVSRTTILRTTASTKPAESLPGGKV